MYQVWASCKYNELLEEHLGRELSHIVNIRSIFRRIHLRLASAEQEHQDGIPTRKSRNPNHCDQIQSHEKQPKEKRTLLRWTWANAHQKPTTPELNSHTDESRPPKRKRTKASRMRDVDLQENQCKDSGRVSRFKCESRDLLREMEESLQGMPHREGSTKGSGGRLPQLRAEQYTELTTQWRFWQRALGALQVRRTCRRQERDHWPRPGHAGWTSWWMRLTYLFCLVNPR